MIAGRNIVIKREGNKLFLPTNEPLDGIAPDNMPSGLFFMCTIISYHENSGTIELKLLPNKVNSYHFEISIEVNSDLFSSLYIKKLVFVGLPPKASFTFHPSYDEPDGEDDVYQKKQEQRRATTQTITTEEKPKEREVVDLTLHLSVKDLRFTDGKISFEHYVSQILRKISFDISNPFIKKEHDSIKNYFPKVLRADKFVINLQCDIFDGKIVGYSASSPELSKINDSLFEIVEDLYIEDTFLNNPEEEIYPLKERAEEEGRKIGSEKLMDANWLLNKLITKGRTKHYFHLRYLSDKHSSELFSLRLTGKPISFIFLLPVQSNYCLIWETYSTEEATYVWKLENMPLPQLQNAVQELVECIKWLRKGNKKNYLKEKPNGFTRIEHNYSGDDLGFKKWKSELDEFLSIDKNKA